MSLNQNKVNDLKIALSAMVARIVASSGLSEQAVIDLIVGRVADDATASAGVDTTKLTTVKGAYLVAEKALADAFEGADPAYDSLLKLATKSLEHAGKITDLETLVAGLDNVFNYVGTVAGGADEQSAFDLATLPANQREPGDYHKVATAGFFVLEGDTFFANEQDGLIFNLAGGVDVMDNSNSNVAGTVDEIEVTGSQDDGFVVKLAAALKARLTAIEAAVAKLNAFGSLTPVLHAALLPTLAKATVNALSVGIYTYRGSDANWPVATATARVGEIAVSAGPDVGGEPTRILEYSVVDAGVMYTRTIRGDEDDEVDPLLAKAYPWTSSAGNADELVDLLITEFNAAAQPAQG